MTLTTGIINVCYTFISARPGSCKQTLAFGHSKGNGVYTIYPAHPLVAVQVYCDMTRDGGGWTLLVTSKTPKWNISQVRMLIFSAVPIKNSSKISLIPFTKITKNDSITYLADFLLFCYFLLAAINLFQLPGDIIYLERHKTQKRQTWRNQLVLARTELNLLRYFK